MISLHDFCKFTVFCILLTKTTLENCPSGGFSHSTLYKWRAKFGGIESSDALRLPDLMSENNKLKKLMAETHLDIHALMSLFGVKR